MKKNILKTAMMATLTVSLAGGLSGCVGSNAVTATLMKFNVAAVDNRYARGGLNMLLAPVYGLTMTADAIVFNSLEFWSGKNPINGKSHVFDTKTKTMLNINDDLDPALHDAPLDPITKTESVEKEVYSTQVEAVNATTLDFHIVYTNGEKAILRGEKSGDMVTFYMDGELVTTTSMDELVAYQATNA